MVFDEKPTVRSAKTVFTKRPEQFSSASKHKNDRNVINL